MYVVTGASGNTGSVITNTLLDQNRKVRVVGRNADRLQPFAKRGAEIFVADVNDQASLTKAFTGADAVYAMIPPNATSQDFRKEQRQVADAIAGALERAQVKYAVTLSSVGADKDAGTGPVVGLHEFENRLNQIAGINIMHLRPAYFMENTLGQAMAVHGMGKTAGPLRGDLKVPMIATRDIGRVAAQLLLALNFNGKQTHEFLGQRDLTMDEVTRIIGEAIEKRDLQYMELPSEQVKPAFVQMGMSSNLADLILEMSAAMNSGHMRALEPRSSDNTTPTSYETFVKEEFVPLYQKQSHAA
jgi:uncharacterized protein YbjT (DUF2867 family)